jgi:hypothetical protein
MKRMLAAVAALSIVAAFSGSAVRTPATGAGRSRTGSAAKAFGKLPLAFEPNVGQASGDVRFLAHSGRATVALTSSEAVLSLPENTSRAPSLGGLPKMSRTQFGMNFLGADPSVSVVGADPLSGVSNYLIGNDPRRWRTEIPHYARVVYRDLYSGIDLAFYGNESGHLEYDFRVDPRADPSVIGLGMLGTSRLSLDPSGNLIIGIEDHTLTQLRPRIYQMADGYRQPVAGGYAIDGDRVRFTVGPFDGSRPLVIDPEVVYSTYLGGSTGSEIGEEYPTADTTGHAYICGETDSTDFPITAGAYQEQNAGGGDAFITKMTADGTGVVFSTYLGGTGFDDAVSCVLDSQGNVYAGGPTLSLDFPTTPGAFQPTNPNPPLVGFAGFVSKLSPDGTQLIYSTYVGPLAFLIAIQVDGAGDVFATGITCALDFPTTPGVVQPRNAGGRPVICLHSYPHNPAVDYFVLKLDPSGSAPVYSTYLGGPGDEQFLTGIAIDASGDAYVVGQTTSRHFPTTRGAFQRRYMGGPKDVAIAKLDPTGSRLLYSTYLGGSGDEAGDHISVDAAGNAYVNGFTSSADFPVTAGAFQTRYGGGDTDGFVTKLNPTGTTLAWSTYLGGSGGDVGTASVIDGEGHVYAAGFADSTDFPVTEDAFQSTNHGGGLYGDGTIAELTSDGSGLVFSTFWGGSEDDGVNGIALGGNGNLYATGCTESTDFPTTPGTFQESFQGGTPLGFSVCEDLPTDAFVTKISFNEDDDQAKPVQRGPSEPAQRGLRDAWGWKQGLLDHG